MGFDNQRRAVRNFIRTVLQNPNRNSKVVDASKYMALNESGGLYRPLLLLAVARDYSANDKDALPIAVAVELVHVASLIADDIMDNSDMRRGKPSCHIKYGKDIAILTQMYVREIAESMLMKENSLSDRQRVEIAARAAEVGKTMIYGQERDVLQRGLDSIEKILEMYEEKSGALIGLALTSGGIIGNASNEDIETLRKLGISMGVSYQINDDFLDAFASVSETGKPERQDANKKNLLSILGPEKIKNLRDSKDRKVEDYLNDLSVNSLNLREIVTFLRKKNGKHFEKHR